jgi:hypothetical protein
MAGSPLNYTHRRTKLEAQMRSEVESLFCRARVINKGLEVFGYFDAARRLLMPSTAERIYATFAGAGYVDDLCLWHRQVARDVEQIQAREATYEVTLSLGMDFNHVGHLRTGYRDYFYSDPTRRGALVQNLLDQLRERARLSFSLRDQDQNFPYPGLTPELSSALGAFARIEAVAVTVTLPAEAKKDWRFHVKLVRDDHFDSEILLSNVGPLEDGPRWLSNRTLANRPLKGLWSMDFLPDPIVNGGAGDARRLDRTQWPIQDVQLHVRLTARQRE